MTIPATSIQRPRRTGNIVQAVVSTVVVLGIWEIVARMLGTGNAMLAAPSEIAVSLVVDSSLYAGALAATAWVAVRGFLFGTALALVLAAIFVQWRWTESLFQRLALTLYCLPLVAVLPLLQLMLPNDAAKVTLAALAVFFSSLVGGMLGLKSADRGALTMIAAWGGGPVSELRYVRARASLPAVLTAMQIGAPAAVLGAVFGEFIGSNQGLGVLIVVGLSGLNLTKVWASAVLATLLASVAFSAFGRAKALVAPWSLAGVDTSARTDGAAAKPGAEILNVVGSIAIVISVWWIGLIVLGVPALVSKSPADVLEYLFLAPEAPSNLAKIVPALWTTLVHSGLGFVAGMVFGIGSAMIFVIWPVAERALSPVLLSIRSVPLVVLIPLLIPLVGRDIVGVVVIAAITTFFPTLTNTLYGMRAVPEQALTIMRSYDASQVTTLFRVRLPYAVPAIFASARLAAPAAVFAATLAEWLASGDGLGHAIMFARATYSYTELWSAAVILTAVSILAYSVIALIERIVLSVFAPAHNR